MPRELYFPAIDGLRALSIGLVLLGHLAIGARSEEYGVYLFFVISGFLITRILLDCRNNVEAGSTWSAQLGHFYARRALRIFPAYYLMLAVCTFAGLPGFLEPLWWLAFYGTNLYIWLNNQWIGAASHLWSLAVEEQFYVLWPLILLVFPKRLLVWLCLGGIVAAWISAYLLFSSKNSFWATMPNVMGLFLITGALAAVAVERVSLLRAERVFRLPGLIGLGIFIWWLWLGPAWPFEIISTPVVLAFFYTGIDIFFTWLVLALAARNFRRLTAVFVYAPVRYVGRISYGLYLFHLPVFTVTKQYYPVGTIANMTLSILASLALASLSFHLFETPIRNLKARLPYGKRINDFSL